MEKLILNIGMRVKHLKIIKQWQDAVKGLISSGKGKPDKEELKGSYWIKSKINMYLFLNAIMVIHRQIISEIIPHRLMFLVFYHSSTHLYNQWKWRGEPASRSCYELYCIIILKSRTNLICSLLLVALSDKCQVDKSDISIFGMISPDQMNGQIGITNDERC